MEKKKLTEVLEKHKKWLKGDDDGKRANLCGADLRGANLRGADLRGANLRDADLRDADLRGANLRGANLRDADLCDADLCDANLCGANLCGANLCDADLRSANLCGAQNVPYIPIECPDTGSFVAWKKCIAHGRENEPLIVKLLIPEDAKRSSAWGRKCRASKAVVLEVQDMGGNKVDKLAYSTYVNSQHFVYEIGKTVEPQKPFDEDRWKECASGIHFFINRQEAVEYQV